MGTKNIEGNSSKVGSRWTKINSGYNSGDTQELAKQVTDQGEIMWNRLKNLKEDWTRTNKSSEQFVVNPEALERLWLESFDFKIDSSNWTRWEDINGTKYLINPEKDIWEIILPDGTREQLFTQIAAIRETQKAWKTIPTKEQFAKIRELYWQNWEKLSKELWLPMKGYWSQLDNLYYRDSMGHYWSISSYNSLWYSLHFDKNIVLINTVNSIRNAFPVRCTRDGVSK